MFGLGLPELIVIFLVILLLFGAKSLPEIAKGLGQAVRLFKREIHDINQDSAGGPGQGGSPDSGARDRSNDFKNAEDRANWRPPAQNTSDTKAAG